MIEKEVKILDVDPLKVARKLGSLGAKKVFQGELITVYYDFPGNALRKSGKVFRIKKKGAIAEICIKIKKPGKKLKVMEEYETAVGDFETAEKIFTALNLKKTKEIRKKRTSYVLSGVHFEIDEIPGIPPFLEIEAGSWGDIRSFAAKLGLGHREMKAWSVVEVMSYYGKRQIGIKWV